MTTLTETYLRKLPKRLDKPTLTKDSLTLNLYVKQATSGLITFLHRTRKGGAWRVHTIGRWPDVSLAAAREKAAALNNSAQPLSAVGFGDLLQDWFETMIEPRYKVTRNIEAYVAFGKRTHGSKKASALTTSELVKTLQEKSKAGSPVAANRCLSNWKACLAYGMQTGALERNVLQGVTIRVIGGTETPKSRTLSHQEIRALWSWDHPNATLLKFLMCTSLRISEAQQGYRDGDKFRIDHTKNGSAHWVHISKLAEANLIPFETSPTAVQAWLKRKLKAEGIESFTPHDLRRSASSILHEIGVDAVCVEKVLNHKLAGMLQTYNVYLLLWLFRLYVRLLRIFLPLKVGVDVKSLPIMLIGLLFRLDVGWFWLGC